MKTYRIYDENCQCAFVAEVQATTEKEAIKLAKKEKNINSTETKYVNNVSRTYKPKLYAIEQQ